VQPVGRLFSDSTLDVESSKVKATSYSEPVKESATKETEQSAIVLNTSSKSEVRGSLIIHHDSEDESDHMEITTTTTDSINILEDENVEPTPADQPPAPLNEIQEVDEEEDVDEEEVVTVLKTPRPNPLQSLPMTQELESPLANKTCLPHPEDPIDINDSDKENLLSSTTVRPTATTPRRSSRRSESYVTAMSSVPPEDRPNPRNNPKNPSTNHPTQKTRLSRNKFLLLPPPKDKCIYPVSPHERH
jgi:hypothetical protein